MSLVYTYLTIGMFVTFSRFRSWPQILVMVLLAPVVAIVCNFVRILIWGIASIQLGTQPTSGMPRVAAGILTMILAYVLFAGVAFVLSRAVVDREPAPTGVPS